MKIRNKLGIILAILLVSLNGTIAFLIYKRTRHQFIKEVRERAKLIALELETARSYLASSLKKSGLEINENTKHFIPAISTNAISQKFTEKTGFIIKQTSLRFRNKDNKPDAFEERVLRKMEENPDLSEYWEDSVIDGKKVERYMYALYVQEDCLFCHGPKEKAPKYVQQNYTAGYDYKTGDIRGAFSVIIPKDIDEQRFIANVIFFISVGIVSVILIVFIIFFTTRKLLKPVERLTAAVTTITKTGDLTIKTDISSKDEVGQLGRAFDDMATKLQASYTLLEQRIAEKTAHLQKAIIALKRANKMKSEFLANMSHELRTPLNAIIGFAEVLRDKICGELNEDQLDFVKDIHSSGEHLLQMINDILDLSKIEAGKMELQYEVFLVKDAIDEVCHILKGLAGKKHLKFEFNIQQDVESIEADRVKFKQILYNLLSNAIKFTPKNGSIVTKAHIVNNKLQVSVSDTGIGMKPEEQQKVFKEFWQAESSYSRKYEGTGLGLTLTKRIVEMHRGRIWFESKFEKGTTFYFELPLEAALTHFINEEGTDLKSITSQVKENAKTILVIEDNLMAADLLNVYLSNAGYNVIIATNGEEALQKAREFRPFLITLDIILKGMDGWDVLSQFKNSKETADIPVIIVSIVDNQELGYSLGAAEYLIKPINREKLIHAVKTIAASQARRDAQMKILIIDDDKATIKYISTILKRAGFQTLKAFSGKEGIDLALKSLPDLIILDLMMPEINGFEVIESLRKHSKTAGIPIIICTAKDITPEDKNKLNGNILAIVQKGSHTSEDLLMEIKKTEQLHQEKMNC